VGSDTKGDRQRQGEGKDLGFVGRREVPWLRKMSRMNCWGALKKQRGRGTREGPPGGRVVVGCSVPYPGPPADWPIIIMQAI